MKNLQKEFEAIGYASWINSDIYPDGEIYTKEYTHWLEAQVLELRKHVVSNNKVSVCEHKWEFDGMWGMQPMERCDKCNLFREQTDC